MIKISKVAISLTTITSLVYAFSLPVFAEAVSLCPNNFSGNNTLCQAASVGGIVQTIINIIIFVAFIAALIFLIYGGIRWIISGGDKEGTAKAKGTVTSALIGLAVVLGAWILINILLNFFGITGGLSGLTVPILLRSAPTGLGY